MIKKILLIATVFITINLAKASSQDSRAKAKAILDDLSKTAKAYSSIKLEFIYTLQNEKYDINERHSGIIVIKENKYFVSTPLQEVYSDGKTTWSYFKSDKKVTISNASEDKKIPGNEINPLNLFTIYEKGFDYELVDENKTTQIINLIPTGSSGHSFQMITLRIDKTKKQLTKMRIKWDDDTNYVYTVNSFITNAEIDDKKFTFNKKGIEVLDLR